ncbi:TetR/AcrR family transcriptional regulator, partial [Acidobacteriota bacterium]
VEEICQKADVSKMTFYKYFENKLDISRTVINQIMNEKEKEYRILRDVDMPYVEKAKLIVQKKMEGAEEFSQEFADDILRSGDPEIVELMTQRTRQVMEIFISDLISAQEKGQVRGDVKPDFVLYVIESMKDMIMNEKFSNLFDSRKEMMADLTNFFFYGILSRNTEKET